MPRPIFSHPTVFREQSNAVLRTVSSSFTITSGEPFYILDSSGGNFTITLPLCDQTKGRRIAFYKKVGANAVTLQASGSDKIGYGGGATISLNTIDSAALIVSDGVSVWMVESSK